MCCFFFFKQKTAYELRISDWSSDVCSSDLRFTRETLSLSISAPVESEAPPIAPIAPELAVLTPSVNDCSSRVSCPTPTQLLTRSGISVISAKDLLAPITINATNTPPYRSLILDQLPPKRHSRVQGSSGSERI